MSSIHAYRGAGPAAPGDANAPANPLESRAPGDLLQPHAPPGAADSAAALQRPASIPGPSAMAPVTVALSRLDYAQATQPPLRSTLGRQGVYFVQLPDRSVVMKPSRGAHKELLATRLAQAVGLNVASQIEVVDSPNFAMRKLCQPKPKVPVLLMTRLDGVSFQELESHDVRDLQECTPRGLQIFHQFGEIYAFDCFIGNEDRFPLGPTRRVNQGNLLLHADRVYAIDNTLKDLSVGTTTTTTTAAPYLTELLAALRQGSCVPQVGAFLQPHAQVDWDRLGAAFLDGARQAAGRIGKLSPGVIRQMVGAAGGPRHEAPQLVEFLTANAARFAAAQEEQPPQGSPA